MYRKKKPIVLMELRATYAGGGGPDKTILLSAERHDRRLVNPIVVYLKDIRDRDFQIGCRAQGRGYGYYEVLDRRKVDFQCLYELYRIARRHRVDLIHGHDYKTDPLAFLLKQMLPGVRIVSTAHGWITNTARADLYKRIHLRFLRHFDRLIAVSQATKSLMADSGIAAERIEVLHNGIDEQHWQRSSSRYDLRRQYEIPADAPVVGSVGRLGEEKDYRTLLRAAVAIRQRAGNCYFMIVGDGKDDERPQLESYARELNIDPWVRFTGYRSDLLEVYRTFDVFLLTSITEGMPNAVLEAMSMSLPVVSTKVGGVAELIVDGRTGILVPAGDDTAIAENVLGLIQNPELRRQMGEQGRNRIEKHFSFDARTRRIEAIYRQMVT